MSNTNSTQLLDWLKIAKTEYSRAEKFRQPMNPEKAVIENSHKAVEIYEDLLGKLEAMDELHNDYLPERGHLLRFALNYQLAVTHFEANDYNAMDHHLRNCIAILRNRSLRFRTVVTETSYKSDDEVTQLVDEHSVDEGEELRDAPNTCILFLMQLYSQLGHCKSLKGHIAGSIPLLKKAEMLYDTW